ncbi:GNAT family N-acetyltransferase [Geodermatophilus maliterrae]|uniref:GNAT family N-acetyltransferase n=1 Tax=Geodermatophilus maliterrae TaxID=3162531 RepID=A0ABV3XN76_9ACTN
MKPVIETTTVDDPALRALVAAQEQEVMARYGVADAGPGLSATSPCLLAHLDGEPVGCVALGSLGDGVGEIKRMYVTPRARGHRIGRLLLEHVEDLAARYGYRLLRLETGTKQPEAVGLYRSAGWQQIPCYGYFKDDPTTFCFEKALTATTA